MAGKQKEIQFSPRISVHDYGHKLRKVRDFLTARDTVLVRILFKGREMTHLELGQELLSKLLKDVQDCARVNNTARMEGKSLQILLLPKS